MLNLSFEKENRLYKVQNNRIFHVSQCELCILFLNK